MTHELPRRPTLVAASSSRTRFNDPLPPPLPLPPTRNSAWGRDHDRGGDPWDRPSSSRDLLRDSRDPRDLPRNPRHAYPPLLDSPLSASSNPRHGFEIPYRAEQGGPNPRKRSRHSSDDDRDWDRPRDRDGGRDRDWDGGRERDSYGHSGRSGAPRPVSPDWRGGGSRRESTMHSRDSSSSWDGGSSRRPSDSPAYSHAPNGSRYPPDDRRDDRHRRPDSWSQRPRLDDRYPPSSAHSALPEPQGPAQWPDFSARLPARPLSPTPVIPLRQLPPHMQARRPPSPSPPPPPRDPPQPNSFPLRRPLAAPYRGPNVVVKDDPDRSFEAGEISSRSTINGRRTSLDRGDRSPPSSPHLVVNNRSSSPRERRDFLPDRPPPPRKASPPPLVLRMEPLRPAVDNPSSADRNPRSNGDSLPSPHTPPLPYASPPRPRSPPQRPPSPSPTAAWSKSSYPAPASPPVPAVDVPSSPKEAASPTSVINPIPSPTLNTSRPISPSPPPSAVSPPTAATVDDPASSTPTGFETPTGDAETLQDGPEGKMDVDEEEIPEEEPDRVPSPPQPPPDFSSFLTGVIGAHETDDGEVNAVMEANRAKTQKERTEARASNERLIRDLSNLDLQPGALEAHDRLRTFLGEAFAERDARRAKQTVELRAEYKALNKDWRAHCHRLDHIKDRIHRRHQPATVPATPAIDSSGLPYYPEPATPGPSSSLVGGGGRPNRRTATAGAFGYGDAVRSEAEFLEILASLETADLRDPNVRATRTAAVVPDMALDPSERRALVALDDTRRIVDDPIEFYGIDAPLDLWTEDEVQVFCKRYSQHPKQFGRIAAELPDKTTAQCVLFYYRMKNTIDFRSLSDRRSRDGRRRKNRRRTDATAAKSLLSNLQRAPRPDDRDEDDDSPPPSPRNGRRSLPETPSVFQPPESTSRPPIQRLDDADDAPGSTARGGKKVRVSAATTPKVRDNRPLLPPSEGMLEAAEVLGALAAGGATPNEGDDADDDGTGKARKRKVRLEVDGTVAGENKERPGYAAGRRKSASSSYWSVAERNEFVVLLGLHGKNWTRLAEGLENKTAVQCRNWFQNHAKKLNLTEIAATADGAFDDDGDDDVGSGDMTPNRDFTAPTGVPISEALTGGTITAVPRAGFFIPEGGHRLRSPRLPSLEIAAFDDKGPKAGMQIRNLLNDETPDEEVPPPARDDWFGAAGAETGSVSTEDESDVPKPRAPTRSPPPRTENRPAAVPYTYGRGEYSENNAYRSTTAFTPSYPPPGSRYGDHSRGQSVLNSPWQQSPGSPYPPPFGTPMAQGDYHRSPAMDGHPQHHHSSSRSASLPPRTDYFGHYDQRPPPRASYLPAGAKYVEYHDGRNPPHWSPDMRR